MFFFINLIKIKLNLLVKNMKFKSQTIIDASSWLDIRYSLNSIKNDTGFCVYKALFNDLDSP